ncbi:hypothetical protein AB0B57_09680 [Micromonospora sp. NPDC049101]|uniref:hypothetical protein n=1 Tax=Micromonospora sp. NPDC049101 TaxID=3155032 RepID=UPI0033FB67B5
MDPEFAALSAAGAQTIVTLVATEAWGQAKELIVRAFTRNSGALSRSVESELQRSHDAIVAADSSGDFRIREQEQARWDARLRLLMLESPETASMIGELIRSAGVSIASSSQAITMHAKASGQARIYQQGHGTQHNS